MQNIFLDNTAIEIHREIQTGHIRHVVFDFDGTISLIRDGWQNVMVPMMIELLQTETNTTEIPEQLEALVVEFVDRLTGKQTIYQMIQLSEEIEKRGGTPQAPLAYKDEYNRRLLPVVEARICWARRRDVDCRPAARTDVPRILAKSTGNGDKLLPRKRNRR